MNVNQIKLLNNQLKENIKNLNNDLNFKDLWIQFMRQAIFLKQVTLQTTKLINLVSYHTPCCQEVNI